MNFEKKLVIVDKKETTIFEWSFNKKNYHLPFRGQGRRVKSFEWLLESYPNYFNVHDPKITKKYDDSNKAVNELIHDEGFNGFVFEKKNTSSIGKKNKVKSYKLDLEKICKHLDRGGSFAKKVRRQPNKKIMKQLLIRSKSCCEITGYTLFTNKNLKKKINNIFLSRMLEIEFDHKVPIFKGGSDDNSKLDNWQVLSKYVNKEKNKICTDCYLENCDNCALAYPEKSSVIKPTGQSLKNCKIILR